MTSLLAVAACLVACGGNDAHEASTTIEMAGKQLAVQDVLVNWDTSPQGFPLGPCLNFMVVSTIAADSAPFPAGVVPTIATVNHEDAALWSGSIVGSEILVSGDRVRAVTRGCAPPAVVEGMPLDVVFQMSGPNDEIQFLASPATALRRTF
ncbi:hypothetical protein [Caenimonas aquaedulcis]|uniref:Uncharacterized protein n=1 Tax=Caenimonas aquaedulcis TaxID=2793270 RepID=A0A931H8Q6_9BURK|nr:hypothetical protein [Caenimonas aquaedulcis]MBG9390613.1 hypothetical protein [Caenimonas aquaedulcis]